MPHQRPLPEATEEYPLLLVPIEVLPFGGGEGSHMPYLQQIAGSQLLSAWESWLEINPETAHELDVEDGDMVWVESALGRLRVRARYYAGARPGVVHMPLGYGHSEGSEWSRAGVNPLSIIEENRDPVGGLPQAGRTHVRVYRS